ncbi:hypothetical protein GCM10027614_39000 [Micromonospora vulcania]
MQREDLHHVLQAASLDDLQRAAGQDLLGRLEDEPDPAVQLAEVGELGQQHADAEQDRGVHVVAAGVADALHRGPVGHVLGVVERQRVDVGAQRHDRAVGTAVDVADHAVALGQQPWVQPGQREFPGDQGGRLELRAGQLGVRVEVTARGDQPGYAERENMVQVAGQGLGPGRRLQPGRPQLAAGGQRQRTRHVEFSITRDGWIIGDSRQPRPPAVTLRNLVTVMIRARSVTYALLGALGDLRDSR